MKKEHEKEQAEKLLDGKSIEIIRTTKDGKKYANICTLKENGGIQID